MANHIKKYQRCMVMAGGGFRFGYYLGIYAAMQERNKTPDLLLASCGGAIAAAIIQALPDDAQRKAWLKSPEMHAFWRGLKSNPRASISRSLFGAIRRRFFVRGPDRIPDLYGDYLFEIPAQLPLPAPSQNSKTAIAIISGKMLYTEAEVGQARGARKLFAETVACEPRAAALLAGMRSPLGSDAWNTGSSNAISSDLSTEINLPVGDAVRASISDMFYFRCHTHGSDDYIGGVIDLFPIEVARCLAEEVIMEQKGPYDITFSLPALRSVLGIDGNRRLDYVLQQHADIWVNTSDMQKALKSGQIQKKMVWKDNRLEIVAPESYDAYLQMIDAQWQFGYERGLAASSQKR